MKCQSLFTGKRKEEKYSKMSSIDFVSSMLNVKALEALGSKSVNTEGIIYSNYLMDFLYCFLRDKLA